MPVTCSETMALSTMGVQRGQCRTGVRVQALGKRFFIGSRVKAVDTLGQSLSLAFSNGLRSVGRRFTSRGDVAAKPLTEFWALRDISFDVAPGQVLGIIGRNGSGKSTLLKILSRITPPSEGEATISGRVGSLLEIGTGFHAELTGRENTYLSGTILGMRRREISERFDEIVEFSGVERFIDTPVKHYSSGMYLRLAFAVAAHLRTEILLVDEVLAVGDAAFQLKCLDKMGQLALEGRTILFVSHNLGALLRLCDRGMLLESGRVAAEGTIEDAVAAYGRLNATGERESGGSGHDGVGVHSLRVPGEQPVLSFSEELVFTFDLSIRRRYWEVSVYVGVSTPENIHLLIEVAGADRFPELLEPGRYRVTVRFPPVWLRPRGYSVWVKVIAHPQSGPTERYYAEGLEIVVTGAGQADANADRLLAPASSWTVEKISRGVRDDLAGGSGVVL